MNNDNTTFSTTKISWTYDALSRLTKEVYDYGNDDTLSGGAGKTTDDYTDAYVFDLDGNRILKAHDISNDGTIDQAITSSFNSNNEILAETDNSTYRTAYGYDANGSTITKVTKDMSGTTTESDSYTFDLRNRLIADTVAGTSSTDTYDPEDNRVSETVGTLTTSFVNDANNPSGYAQVLEERQGSVVNGYLISLPGVIQQDMNGTPSYFLPDGHQSTRLLTSTTHSITGEYDYDAYGNPVNLSSTAEPWAISTPSLYRYVAGRVNIATGEYQFGNRLYAPPIGAWNMQDDISVQPGDTLNGNLFGYVHADPTNAWDPTGQDFTLLTTLALLGAEADLSATALHNMPGIVSGISTGLAAIGNWTLVTVGSSSGAGEPLTVLLWGGIRSPDTTSLLDWIGATLSHDAWARSWYKDLVHSLPKTASAARTSVKIQARKISSPVGEGVAEWMQPIRQNLSKIGGSANRTNALVDAFYSSATKIGPALMVVGAAISVYNIYSAENHYEQTAKEVGGWTGGIVGGYAGAEAGLAIGTLFGGPVGGLFGTIVGGVVGAIYGAEVGEVGADKAYHLFV